jgi:hypothetical protein
VNGGDAAILSSFIFLHVAAAGPGAFSFDALLRRSSSEPRLSFGAPVAIGCEMSPTRQVLSVG